jgi:NhaP-type Na+/H+ or K+/H+ antiporter
MVIFSVFVSIVFATLMRETPADQFRFALRLIAGFIAAGIVIGWLLYPLPV